MEFLFQFVTELLTVPEEEQDIQLAALPIIEEVEEQDVVEGQNIFLLGEFH